LNLLILPTDFFYLVVHAGKVQERLKDMDPDTLALQAIIHTYQQLAEQTLLHSGHTSITLEAKAYTPSP
jgi:hypothetical protein